MSDPDVQPVATVSDLHISLRRHDGYLRAVRGVSFEIRPHEIVALVGESGSGKSVLSQAVLGFLPAAREVKVEGSVTVAGVDMLHAPDDDRRAARRNVLGAVFQDPLMSLNPSMTVGKQLTERGIGSPLAVKHMVEAGVPAPERRSGQFPYELSGGLRQRVMIAMARGGSGLLHGKRSDEDPARAPQLIVADEPTTALDTSVQAQILLLFDRLRREHGTAVLFVTHDLAVAGSIADRILVMYAGRLCEEGETGQVLSEPRHPYTAALLAANRELRGDGRGSVVPDRALDPINLPSGCAFGPRCAWKTAECDERPPVMTPMHDNRKIACLHPIDPGGRSPAAVEQIRVSPAATAADATPVLELRAVSKAFASQGRFIHAVDDVSITVRHGACVGLVGESGSGKSTVLRLAAGLTQPSSGTVVWAGRRPQLVYQDATASLTPWMSIGDQIGERLALRGVPRAQRAARTGEYLDRVHLDSKVANARPRELSGGQRQRAAIARALSSEPQVLLCDEPVSALDATLTVRILRLLDELRTSLGVGLLVVTHDLDAARAIAQETFVMYHGRIVERAPTSRVFDDPRHPYSKGLLAASPGAADGHLSPTLDGEPPDPFMAIAGCAFADRCPIAIDRCRVERPELRVLDDGSEVACHLA